MKYKPLFGNITVREVKEEKSLVYENPSSVIKGVVIETGTGEYKFHHHDPNNQSIVEPYPVYEPMQVRPGLTVLFDKNEAREFQGDNNLDTQYLLDQHRIIAVLED